VTIGGYDAVYVVTLITTTFGALTFSVLTIHYWRSRSSRRDPVFAAYTLVCAAAFLINVLARIKPLWETPFAAALDLVTGLVPPLLLHLVSRDRSPRLRIAFYVVSSAAALAVMLDDVSVITVPFRDQIPAILLAAAGVLGLAFRDRENTRLRRWYGFLLVLTVAGAVADIFMRSAITVLAPDYLLLAFFCVTLYYRERLIFFDLFIKRGAFFCFALAALAFLLWTERVPDWLTLVLILASLWLLAPWIDATLARLVDQLFLRRRYSPAEVERLVINELQLATTEDDLRSRAERCLSDVFQGVAQVRFQGDSGQEEEEALVAAIPGFGHLTLKQRSSGIPYMTEDGRLLDSLARTLGVMLENVRFREQQLNQQEREQQLRLLASRAELKALRAQINPHFLFNALNAIAGLIPSQPDLADQAVEQLAQVFRYTLRKSDKEWARLDEEAEFAAAYLSLEKTRFRERLQVELSIDPDAGAVSVPAMCVQPLIENAIRHGTSAVEGPGVVGLSIRVDGSMVSIEVSDNGPGFPCGFSLAASTGHGLRNVAERIQGYFGDSARLSWESGSNSTRVLLQVPRELEKAP
jgi:signal transduction histidine kinase